MTIYNNTVPSELIVSVTLSDYNYDIVLVKKLIPRLSIAFYKSCVIS